MRPIDLCLLARERLQTEERLTARRSEIGNGTAESARTAFISSGVNHLVNPCCEQSWIPCKGFPDEVGIRIHQTGTRNPPAVELLRLQSASHRIRMQPEFCSNRADFPMLCVEQVPNLSDGFLRNHSLPPCKKWISPAPGTAANRARGSERRISEPRSRPAAAGFRCHPCRFRKTRRNSGSLGRLIRHACLRKALPVLPLTISMVQSSFETRLMPSVRQATLDPAGVGTAGNTAVTLAAVARAANPEQRSTSRSFANRHNENDFRAIRHLTRRSGLDNGRKSWQSQSLFVVL